MVFIRVCVVPAGSMVFIRVCVVPAGSMVSANPDICWQFTTSRV
jgi:hypothetical protein